MNRGLKLCLLAALFVGCALAAWFQSALDRRWQSTRPAELYDVVSRQLAAFRVDDYPAAYQQVSMGFQERVNIEMFTDLAHAEYPGLVRAVRVEFGAVLIDGRHATVPAYFFLPEGETVPCLYRLVREDDGWKIDTVRVLKRWPPTRRLGGSRA